MNPRLKSSKKWTAFPKEYADQILGVYNEHFAQYLDNGSLLIEGRIYSEEVLLRVGYLEKGRLAQANFEISMGYSQESQDAIQSIHSCVDVAASMLQEYFETDGEVDFPYSWKEYPYKGQKLYLQFSTENSSLEAEADKLLGLSNEQLFHDSDESDEDALSRAEQSEELSPPRDDEDYEDETEEDQDDDGAAQTESTNRRQTH